MVAGKTGVRAFFVDESGEMYSCDNSNHRYSGLDKRPVAAAAALAEGLDSTAAPNCVGTDGVTRKRPNGASIGGRRR
ncbi:MAG: hypothetical protein ABIP94_13920 [Planctomycetota bacterium]